LNNSFYHEDNIEDETYDRGWLTAKTIGEWQILILIGEENFLFLIMIGEKITHYLLNIG